MSIKKLSDKQLATLAESYRSGTIGEGCKFSQNDILLEQLRRTSSFSDRELAVRLCTLTKSRGVPDESLGEAARPSYKEFWNALHPEVPWTRGHKFQRAITKECCR